MSRWSQWSPCSVTCNDGIQTRTRQCLARGPAKKAYHLTYYCYGKLHESRECHQWACQGHFGEWADWSSCSATCGYGIRKRERNCYGAIDCEKLGPLAQEEVCPDLPRCQGTLGQWSEWSQCSTTCGKGSGTRQRQRSCIGPGDCYGLGPLKDEDICPDQPICQGTFGPWSEWGACSVTCGYEGYQERTRECSSQYSCVGHKVETQTCDIIPCKGKICQSCNFYAYVCLNKVHTFRKVESMVWMVTMFDNLW